MRDVVQVVLQENFDKLGHPKYKGDIIDWIWKHIQCGELSQLVNTLKASQTITTHSSKDILQEIAKEILNVVRTNSSFHSRISEICTSRNTFDGECPLVGAFMPEGKLFCSGYHFKKWFSDRMAPHRDETKAIREQHGDYKGKH